MAARQHCHHHNKTLNKVSGALQGRSCLRSITVLQGQQQICTVLLWSSYRETAACFSHRGALHSAQQASEQAGGRENNEDWHGRGIVRVGVRDGEWEL